MRLRTVRLTLPGSGASRASKQIAGRCFPPRGWRQTARQSQPNTRTYRVDLPRPDILCQECGRPAYRRSDCPRPPETRKSGCRRENRGTFLRD